MILNDIFATNVRKARNSKGWSQDELGERSGLTRNYIGEIERAEKSPTLDTVEALANALDVKPEVLITRS